MQVSGDPIYRWHLKWRVFQNYGVCVNYRLLVSELNLEDTQLVSENWRIVVWNDTIYTYWSTIQSLKMTLKKNI